MTHKLVKLEEVQGNILLYKFLAECSCGFQTRRETKAVAQSQFASHLSYHGVVYTDKDLDVTENVINPMETQAGQLKQKQEATGSGASWSPKGA